MHTHAPCLSDGKVPNRYSPDKAVACVYHIRLPTHTCWWKKGECDAQISPKSEFCGFKWANNHNECVQDSVYLAHVSPYPWNQIRCQINMVPTPGRSVREKKSVPKRQFYKKTACVQPWLVAIGGWQLVATGGWWRLVVGDWWLLAVGSGWRLAVGRRWRLAAVGSWRLVVPWGWSLRAVLSKRKNVFLKDHPALRPLELRQGRR